MSKKKNQEPNAEVMENEAVEQEAVKESFLKRPKVKKTLLAGGLAILGIASNAVSYGVGHHRGYKSGYDDGTEYAENEINYKAYLEAPADNSETAE